MKISVNDQIEKNLDGKTYASIVWQVEVELLLSGNIATEDATTLHDAINTIRTVASKYKPRENGDE